MAVDDVSLDLLRGKVLVIVGGSGSKKSVSVFSILKLIQNPGRILDGNIVLRSRNREPVVITGLSEKGKLLYEIRGGIISMIFQEPMTALSPVHTIGNQICEALLLHTSLSNEDAEKRAVDMLK